MVVDVDGLVGVKGKRRNAFQVRLQKGGRRLLNRTWRFRLPTPYLEVGSPVTALNRQCRHGADVGTKTFGQTRPKPPDKLTQPEQVKTVPTSFVLPIVQRHGMAFTSPFSRIAADTPAWQPDSIEVTTSCPAPQGTGPQRRASERDVKECERWKADTAPPAWREICCLRVSRFFEKLLQDRLAARQLIYERTIIDFCRSIACTETARRRGSSPGGGLASVRPAT